MQMRSDIQEKEECLLKIFNEKEEIFGKYESVRLGIEEEFGKMRSLAEVKERVANTLKKENEGESK